MLFPTTPKTADALSAIPLHPSSTGADFFTGAATEQASSVKAIATEIALLAMAGYAVHKGRASDFIVSKYDTMTKYCEDFAELQAFFRRIGVTK